MSGLWVLFLLLLFSSIPAAAVYVWFRVIHFPFSLTCFLCSLLAGAAAFFPALLFQHFFPVVQTIHVSEKWNLFVKIFVRIALTEELSRFIVLYIFFRIIHSWESGKTGSCGSPAFDEPETSPPSYINVIQAAAIGLVAGIGFAILESAVYGASNAGIILLRAVTTAPLHAACGSRIGATVVLFRHHPSQAVARFLTATAIHGIYNFMIILPGFPSIAAILIAFSALASSIITIQGSRKNDNSGT